jgi:hypothetical protein
VEGRRFDIAAVIITIMGTRPVDTTERYGRQRTYLPAPKNATVPTRKNSGSSGAA